MNIKCHEILLFCAQKSSLSRHGYTRKSVLICHSIDFLPLRHHFQSKDFLELEMKNGKLIAPQEH